MYEEPVNCVSFEEEEQGGKHIRPKKTIASHIIQIDSIFTNVNTLDVHVICKSYFSIAYSKKLNGSTIPSQIQFIELFFDVIPLSLFLSR